MWLGAHVEIYNHKHEPIFLITPSAVEPKHEPGISGGRPRFDLPDLMSRMDVGASKTIRLVEYYEVLKS